MFTLILSLENPEDYFFLCGSSKRLKPLSGQTDSWAKASRKIRKTNLRETANITPHLVNPDSYHFGEL